MIDYKCSKCGYCEGKLWRQYQTSLENIDLLCGQCAWADQQPRESCSYLEGEGSDIGWLVAAIPTADNKTFWGYTSVPQELAVEWWTKPCNLMPKGWRLTNTKLGVHFLKSKTVEPCRTWFNGEFFMVRDNGGGSFWVERKGVGYNGESVRTIDELLNFFVANSGEVDVTSKRTY